MDMNHGDSTPFTICTLYFHKVDLIQYESYLHMSVRNETILMINHDISDISQVAALKFVSLFPLKLTTEIILQENYKMNI